MDLLCIFEVDLLCIFEVGNPTNHTNTKHVFGASIVETGGQLQAQKEEIIHLTHKTQTKRLCDLFVKRLNSDQKVTFFFSPKSHF